MATAKPSVDERRAYGKSRRKVVHRVDQCEWKAAKDRPNPWEPLLAATAGRIEDLLPIRWTRMAASPLGFFRGNVPLMAFDLAHLPHTGIEVQMCGDAHVRNLGVFASPTGALVFDINDFDETLPGPWEWDIKRLAASLVLAGREAGDSESTSRDAVLEFMARYRESVRSCSERTFLQLARHTVHRHVEAGPILGVLEKARRATPDLTLAKLTVAERSGTRRFK